MWFNPQTLESLECLGLHFSMTSLLHRQKMDRFHLNSESQQTLQISWFIDVSNTRSESIVKHRCNNNLDTTSPLRKLPLTILLAPFLLMLFHGISIHQAVANVNDLIAPKLLGMEVPSDAVGPLDANFPSLRWCLVGQTYWWNCRMTEWWRMISNFIGDHEYAGQTL